MKPATYLAQKFLRSHERSLLFSSLTWVAIFGVLISVTAFIVIQAVMAGFNQDLQNKILGFSPHLTISLSGEANKTQVLAKQISSRKEVRDAFPILEGEVILRSLEGDTQGVRVRGMRKGDFRAFQDIEVFFEEGESWEQLDRDSEKLPGIILGQELAASLAIVPAFTEKIELLYPFGEVGPTGELEPQRRVFRVIGTFKSGYYEYDSKYALLDLSEAKTLLGETQDTQIYTFLHRPEHTQVIQEFIQTLPGVHKVDSWKHLHRRLFTALHLERIGMALVLVLIILLASFNIVSFLMMIVFERQRDIAVIKTLGLSKKDVSQIFYRAGFWIGTIGSLGGGLLGILVCKILNKTGLSLPAPYYIEHLPISIRWKWVLSAMLLAPLLCWLATIVPAKEGAKVLVIEGLREE